MKILTEFIEGFQTEICETREMAQIYSRKLRGEELSQAEMEVAHAQLRDLAKVAPLISIILLPGGALLLVALQKLLPGAILPSAFRKSPGD